MKALTVYGPLDARYEEWELPKAQGRYMTVKVDRAGFCATDISIWTGNSSFITDGLIQYPCRFGHEWVGTVVAVGEEVKDFKVGDRVYSDSGISCGQCPDCLEGRYADCKYIRSVGTVNCWEGCFAQYMSIPDFNAYHVPDALCADEAALIEPLSISLDAFHGITPDPKGTIVILGTGAIGMGVVWLAKYFGYGRIVMIGRSENKLAVAKSLGADLLINARQQDPVKEILSLTEGKGASLLVETTGNYDALLQALQMASMDARISILSFYEKNLDQFPMDRLALSRITLVGGAGRFGNPQKVAEIMAKNPNKCTPIISHHVPFEQMLDMMKNLEDYNPSRVKIMIDF